uniref:SufB/SufD family protein n=1 Tax=Eubacterium cellulosolvens TaxID=29322 RepID=UPI0005573D91|nr:SufD family Fe-S cluster assembly protein [[Eubacterium] cellulosolvens]
MSEGREMKLNRLPAITWYWLKMNEATIGDFRTDGSAAVQKEIPEGVTEQEGAEELLGSQATGAGKAFGEAVAASGIGTTVYTVPAGRKIADTLRLKYNFAQGGNTLDRVDLIAEKNSELTVVMDYTSADGASGSACVQTKFDLKENAVLKLVQIVRIGEEYTLVNDLGGRADDSARIELTQLVLDGGRVYQGYQIDLEGYKSSLKNDLAYRVSGSNHLDINNFANHTGKKTESEINVSGVLRDSASKILRATIDLKQGAKGAVGNEAEDVLLMDDGVRNQTIPLILCTEEDVVGNHGATIGRLDENLMFYMESRGMDKETIYEMMAKARIDATIRLIPDEKMRTEISEYVGGGNEDDEEGETA